MINIPLHCIAADADRTMVASVGRVDDVRVEIVEVELFTLRGNNAIVRMPGRPFPGVLVQGDTLSIVREHVAALRGCSRAWMAV